jgi:hypothetical protein
VVLSNDNDLEILDSIAIARETYFFNYQMEEEDDDAQQDEYTVLKFIYEQIANIYTDRSLLQILRTMRHYYRLTFPEHERTFDLFYLSVYPQAVMIDQRSAGIIQINSAGREISNTYTNIWNSINTNNFSQDISLNSVNLGSGVWFRTNELDERPSPNPGTSSLLNEIMFLSTIFNMRSNESLLHVLNLMNQVIESGAEAADQAQTATSLQIKELGSQPYELVGTESKEKNSEYCTICQENYNSDTQVKTLPCGHFFHCECIEPWLLNCSNLCPICRKKIN